MRAPVLVATDLDRTLVHSARAAGPPGAAPVVRLEQRRGVVTAQLTHRAAALLAELDRRALWVPATTRTVAEYRRLDLEGRLGVAPRCVVCANGGVLLVDGEPDGDWAAVVRDRLAPAAPIGEVGTVLARHLDRLDGAGPVRDADGCFLVVRAGRSAGWSAGWLEDLAGECATRGWRVVVHGDKVHVLPVALTKGAAVAEVRGRTGARRVVAAGDSPLDADVLEAADAGIQPVDGRLHGAGRRFAHVAVTAAAGLAAGEEIAAWLVAQVGGDGG
ncbi:HAD family hydrolase [Actinomycetospora straminea]|uniref:Hydroxymethylpyrimidine pyrophosphatase-like HAD family hydrolase n=1 Tax=Actinomycetospora straminea TaxID=663607 RepID=A0ABP9F7Y4_9PSEU|nr:HAD family hydrolase [Actinomycetospora straminea]MDD7936663.1 HAD family hydrolase [Actinomycetospora straminea]